MKRPLIKDVSVKQGDCIINYCWRAYDNGSAAIIEFNTKTKYPVCNLVGQAQVFVSTERVSGHATKPPACVTFKTRIKDVEFFVNRTGRYGFTVIILDPRARNDEKVWRYFGQPRETA